MKKQRRKSIILAGGKMNRTHAEREIRVSAIASASLDFKGSIPTSGVAIPWPDQEERLLKELYEWLGVGGIKRMERGGFYFLLDKKEPSTERVEKVLKNKEVCMEGVAFASDRVLGVDNRNHGNGVQVYMALLAGEPIHRVLWIVKGAKSFAHWVSVRHLEEEPRGNVLSVEIEFSEDKWGLAEAFLKTFNFAFT